MTLIGNIIGEICKKIIPIPEEVFYGNQNSSIAICTLSSVELLKKISLSHLMSDIAVVGRLFSENKGIDSLIRYVISSNNITTVVICGKEVWGHKAGHSLLALHKYGINNHQIINSTSPDPILSVSQNQVEKFRNQVKLINKIGETNFLKICETINSINN